MSRDFQGREKKKPKKDSKLKPATTSSSMPIQPAEVEVVRKKRKKDEFPEG